MDNNNSKIIETETVHVTELLHFGDISYPLSVIGSPADQVLAADISHDISIYRYVDNLPPLTSFEFDRRTDAFTLHVGDTVRVVTDALEFNVDAGYFVRINALDERYASVVANMPINHVRNSATYRKTTFENLLNTGCTLTVKLNADPYFLAIVLNTVEFWLVERYNHIDTPFGAYYAMPDEIAVYNNGVYSNKCTDFASILCTILANGDVPVEMPFYMLQPKPKTA
jgi:hypothetical protein